MTIIAILTAAVIWIAAILVALQIVAINRGVLQERASTTTPAQQCAKCSAHTTVAPRLKADHPLHAAAGVPRPYAPASSKALVTRNDVYPPLPRQETPRAAAAGQTAARRTGRAQLDGLDAAIAITKHRVAALECGGPNPASTCRASPEASHAANRQEINIMIKQNGARYQIIRALAEDGMLPASESRRKNLAYRWPGAQQPQRRQKSGLIVSVRDDVTGLRAWKLTTAGRDWWAANKHDDKR